MQLTIEECYRARIPLRCFTRKSHTWKVQNVYCADRKKNSAKKTWQQAFWHTDVLHKACVCRGNANRRSMCVECIYCCDIQGFLEAPRPLKRPGGLGTSFVKEPRDSCRGRLEHTWQFEPLGRFAGITPNWLWRLAVSPRPKMVCRCALCIGREFGSHGGRKGFFRNHWCGW